MLNRKNLDSQPDSSEVGVTLENLKVNYPELYREYLNTDEANTRLNSSESSSLRGFTPGVEDYLSRAKTVAEADEIIEFLLSKNEFSKEDAQKYKKLVRDGKFLGTREPGYYEKFFRS